MTPADVKKSLSRFGDKYGLKELHNRYPLRHGHNGIFEKCDQEELQRRSIISILCTEQSRWTRFLKEIGVSSPREALRVFLILLSFYSDTSVYRDPSALSVNPGVEANLIGKLESSRYFEKERIPGLVLCTLILMNKENRSFVPPPLRDSSKNIVKNFVDATIIRILRTLAKWTILPPYKIVEYGDVGSYYDFMIKSRYDERQDCYNLFPHNKYFELLPSVCYNAFTDVLGDWKQEVSFWRFLEEKIQGYACNVNKDNAEGDFYGMGSRNRGNFTNGSILWREMNGIGILRTRTEAKVVCSECGAQLIYDIDCPFMDDKLDVSKSYVLRGMTPSKEPSPECTVEKDEDQNVSDNEQNVYQNWKWKHKDNCDYYPSRNPIKYFLVKKDQRLYFHLYEPYQRDVQCVECVECTNEYHNQPFGDARKRCVWPVNIGRRCSCGAGQGAEGTKTTVPIYVSTQKKEADENDALYAPMVMGFNIIYPGRICREFEDADENIHRFEEELANFYGREAIGGECTFVVFQRIVKSLLIVLKFDCWMDNQVGRSLSYSNQQLNGLFEEFWNSGVFLVRQWGNERGIKGRVKRYVTRRYLSQNLD